MRTASAKVLISMVAAAAMAGCSSNNSSAGDSRGNNPPAPTPTATPAVTPTAQPTATPSVTPTAQPTATPTAMPTTTPTPTGSVTPTPTGSVTPTPTTSPTPLPDGARNRYSFNNDCFALKSNANDQYVVRTADGVYEVTGATLADAEPIFMKPAALGAYLLYDSAHEVVVAPDSAGAVSTAPSGSATEGAVWDLRAVIDDTEYPEAPTYNVEPLPEEVAAYRGFVDPDIRWNEFKLTGAGGDVLAVDGDNALVTVAAAGEATASFTLEPAEGCDAFPEASDNAIGDSFKGTTADGRVLGMADVHVHISATTFLGGAEHGSPFHKLGVEHALSDCTETHGDGGQADFVGAVLGNDFDGHNTAGWPDFTDWPARGALTHEAIYWKWLERAWKAGVRVSVNDLVDNQTLCELNRNAGGGEARPDVDCDPMNNAGFQAGSMYAMQDYIDAQYGGRGEGFFQIVHTPEEARARIEEGKMAVVLGIEISNLFNCKVKFNSPLRLQEPYQELGTVDPLEGGGPNEATYTCDDESIAADMDRIWGWGVRQIISIHEFDNAFGGNGIFFDVLNLGTRENSGANSAPAVALDEEGVSALALTFTDTSSGVETPTGEFWTTYDCPTEGDDGFSGYLWGSAGGTRLPFDPNNIPDDFDPFDPATDGALDGFGEACVPMGQGFRFGGPTPCYPIERQCNARWLTPIGLRTYARMMERGFIFDIDHLELEMKTQALELAEAQPIAYPFVSTHGTFGGTSNDQARRIIKNHGFMYPSVGSANGLLNDLRELKGLYDQVVAELPEGEEPPMFGFGFGTDTNGLSDQHDDVDSVTVTYPYTLFSGTGFDELDDFDAIDGVTFERPSVTDADGTLGREWDFDAEGSAQHGMLSGLVEEFRRTAEPAELQAAYDSAERYLRTWERTLEASSKINEAGGTTVPEGVLRPAPPGDPTRQGVTLPAP